MTRLYSVGRVQADLDTPCRKCARPMPLSSLLDGFTTHPSCDLKPPYRQP